MKWLNCKKIRLILVVFLATIIFSGGSAKADFTFGEPVNLEPTVNSSIGEWGAWISPDGLSLWFQRASNTLGPYEAFLATRPTRQDSWDTPVSVGLILGSERSDPASLFKSIKIIPGVTTSDGLELYFEETGPGSYGSLDLYMVQRETIDSDWGAPVNLGPVVNSSADEMCPTISPDGLQLYFSGYANNARPGGYGSADLWVTTRATRNDPWTEPVNLGPTVNTASQDARPRISADGLVLFFDSQRPGGYGSADLYMTRRATLSDPWGEPLNLGPIVNSSAFDSSPFISADGSTLLFDSGRPGGYGDFDIWQAPIIPIVDFNGDGIVDIDDLVIMIENWDTSETLCDIGPMPWGDGVVDDEDLFTLMSYWGDDVNDPTLIANYKLDETQGDIAYDSAGILDGILNGNPTWQPAGGIIDGALELDGIDDFISTPFVLNPRETSEFSVFAWVKGGLPGQVIISQADGRNWLLADSTEGSLMTELIGQGRNSSSLTSQTVITDGYWHRIGLVWDGSERILYVDDIEVARDTQKAGLESYETGLYIGAGSDLEPGSFFCGMIDDVRIYSRAITP